MNQSQIALLWVLWCRLNDPSIILGRSLRALYATHQSFFAFSERFTFYSSQIKTQKPNFTKLSALVQVLNYAVPNARVKIWI